MKFVTVFIAYNLVEAEMVKDALETEGIQAIVLNKKYGDALSLCWCDGNPGSDASKRRKRALQILQELKGH